MEHEGSIYSPHSPLNKKLKKIFAVLKSPDSTTEERRNANREWTNVTLYNIERWDEYFKKPSSGKVVQKRLDYYSFNDLPNYDIQTELYQVTTPTIVYCGRHDAQCPLVFSEEINTGLKNSMLEKRLTMKNREGAIGYCLGMGNTYEDYPFRDKNWTLMRHIDNKKVFAWIFEKDGHIWINVKCEPDLLDYWRQIYHSVVPAFHLNKDHWNSIILDGTVPKEDIYEMIKQSYMLTKKK